MLWKCFLNSSGLKNSVRTVCMFIITTPFWILYMLRMSPISLARFASHTIYCYQSTSYLTLAFLYSFLIIFLSALASLIRDVSSVFLVWKVFILSLSKSSLAARALSTSFLSACSSSSFSHIIH